MILPGNDVVIGTAMSKKNNFGISSARKKLNAATTTGRRKTTFMNAYTTSYATICPRTTN